MRVDWNGIVNVPQKHLLGWSEHEIDITGAHYKFLNDTKKTISKLTHNTFNQKLIVYFKKYYAELLPIRKVVVYG